MPTASQPIVLAADEDGEAPLTVAATVVCVERREEPDFLGGSRVGLSAQLHITIPPDTRPHSYFLSRLIGESAWVIDALFGSNGYPHFSHGFGARYLRLRGVAPELEDLLDQNARDLGLVAAIGHEVPLVLAESAPIPPATSGTAGSHTTTPPDTRASASAANHASPGTQQHQ